MTFMKTYLGILIVMALALASAGPAVSSGTDDSGDDSGFHFYGTVQTVPSGGTVGNWVVGGRTVHVSSSTVFRDSVATGSCVEVEGAQRADASIDASKISTEDASVCGGANPGQLEFFGNLERLPASGLIGDWMVSGKTIHVSANTQIRQERGPLAVGACVGVEGTANADGSINAREVESRSGIGGCAMAPDREGLEVEFFGAVQSLPAGGQTGNWMIGGRLVTVSATTQLDFAGHTVAVGTCVELNGRFASDGSVVATRIHFEDSACQAGARNAPAPRFVGLVQSMSPVGVVGDWLVSARTVHVTTSTEIEQERSAIVVGSCVAVHGAVQADNSIAATEVESEGADDCSPAAGGAGAFHVEGLVDSVPLGGTVGDWNISGRTVRVTVTTEIKVFFGAIVVGACVEARGALGADGVLAANEIEVRSSSGTCLLHGGIVSAASLGGASAAPGEIISIFGLNTGPAGEHGAEFETEDHIRGRIANVRVLFDGQPAPLVYVSPGQINAIVPYSVHGKTETRVQIDNNGAWSNEVVLAVSPAAPSIFTLTQSGRGQGAILNYEAESNRYRVNGASDAAPRGSIIVLYATGEGQSDPAGDDGYIASASRLPHPLLPVRVQIGGKEAAVQYVGGAPGFAAGLLQINVRVSDDTPQGSAIPVTLIVGDYRSHDGVTVAIR